MKKSIYILFAILFTVSCNKNKQILVKGRVLNPVTGEGFEDAEIRLLKSGTGITNVGFENVQSYFTDANGYFEITEKQKGDRWLRAVQEGYAIGWQQSDGFDGDGQLLVTKGEEMNVEYHVVPYGEFKLNITNINCEGQTDSMYFSSKMFFMDDYGLKSTLREGCYTYQSTAPSETPTGYKYFKTEVHRPSGYSVIYDSVLITPDDVTTINIEY